MKKCYKADINNFNGQRSTDSISLVDAVNAIKNNDASTIVLDVVVKDELEDWWNDDGFPKMREHEHHTAINATGITLGQLQREQGKDFVRKVADYFAHSSKINLGLKETKFVKLFMDELGACQYNMGLWAEFMLATKRAYPPHEENPFSFAPHCDVISFARDRDIWPISDFGEQIGAFLTIQGAQNEAGFVLWNYKPESRRELDNLAREYAENKSISILDNSEKITLTPQPGQLSIFNSRNMHAIEKCNSLRRTIGTFLINDGGWKLCH